jgi:hypothetical protein
MSVSAEQLTWCVGARTGPYTGVNFVSPSGSHPLTPEVVRQRYISEVHDSALVVWRLPIRNLGGVRAGIDEVAWRDSDIAHFETWLWRPAKGSGSVLLVAQLRNGQRLNILSSNRYEQGIYDWHLAAAALFEQIYPGLTRICDHGYDA